jgi:hypothetical protein
MNTRIGRLVLVGRDASSAAGAITNLHRCLAKLEERADRLRGGEDMTLWIAINNVADDLGEAKRSLGIALRDLDKVTAKVNENRKRIAMERRAQRERTNRS